MSTETLRFNEAGLGAWTEEREFEVTRERIAQYARPRTTRSRRTSRERSRRRCSRSSRCSSRWWSRRSRSFRRRCSATSCMASRTSTSTERSAPGDRLVARGKMTGFEGLPNGTRASVYLETRDERGRARERAVRDLLRPRLRRRAEGRRAVAGAPVRRSAARAGARSLDVTQRIDDDQTYRYAEASGDPMPIHTRRGGRPRGRAAGDHRPRVLRPRVHLMGDPAGARRVGRAPPAPARRALLEAGPARPGDPYARVGEGAGGGAVTYAYETTVDGTVVLRDGLAVLGDPA